jgi:hypothetical protein
MYILVGIAALILPVTSRFVLRTCSVNGVCIKLKFKFIISPLRILLKIRINRFKIRKVTHEFH